MAMQQTAAAMQEEKLRAENDDGARKGRHCVPRCPGRSDFVYCGREELCACHFCMMNGRLSRSFCRTLGCFRRSMRQQGRVPFLLADIGEGITEVQLIQWFTREGAPIRQFDKIAEVQSDKAAVEITSRYDGTIAKLHYAVNDMAKVGEPLVDIETEDVVGTVIAGGTTCDGTETSGTACGGTETSETACGGTETSDTVKMTQGTRAPTSPDVLAMPAVRVFARLNDVDLATVSPTGRGGRITKDDVMRVMEEGKIPHPVHQTALSFSELPMNPVRRAMARSMQESLAIPHFGYSDEYRLDALLQMRKQFNEMTRSKASLMAFVVKAVSLALRDHGTLNAHYMEGRVMLASMHNIAVAVDTEHGLVVPVLRSVETKSVAQLAEEFSAVTDKARRNVLRREDFEAATFTLSNIGSIGGTYASPLLVPPQVCIGAIGRTRAVPAFSATGSLECHNIACFSWAADHRAVDGATLARFSNRLKALLETPLSLFL